MSSEFFSELDLVNAFAEALSKEQFKTALQYLSTHCIYTIGEQVIEGPHAILKSFQKNASWARDKFEKVVYSNQVESASAHQYIITSLDCISSKNNQIEYKSQYIIEVAMGKIIQITYREISGESEALKQFLIKIGFSGHS